MIYTVDRIEGRYAVCEQEDGKMVNILLSDLPFEVEESTTFTKKGRTYSLVENQREERIGKLMDELWD